MICDKLGHRVSVLYDVEPARAALLAARWPQATVLASPDEIPWASLDAIFVCTPPAARGPIELAAIRYGTPFFVEKPIAVHSRQIQPVVQALVERQVLNSVGYMNRYRASVRSAREALAGRTILGIGALWLAGIYDKPWWSVREQSGGPFNEQGTHFVDLLHYFGGDIEEVSAIGARDDSATVGAVCRFRSGGCGTIFYSCLSQHKQMSFRILCDDGNVNLDGYDLLYGDRAQSAADAWFLEVQAFCEAVQSDRQDLVACSFQDALRTQLTVDAIVDSLSTGRNTRVPSGETRT